MKKIFLTAAIAAFAISTYAQFGVQAGYVLPTTITKIDDSKSDPSSINGIQGGVNYTYYYNDNLFVQPALLYTYGFKNKTEKGTVPLLGDYKFTQATTSHTIDLPIRLGYALSVTDDIKIFAFAGPDFQYNIDQKIAFKSSVENANLEQLLTSLGLNSIEGSIYGTKDDPNKDLSHFDILLGAGLGASYKNISLKAGYDFSLLNKVTGDAAKTASWHTNVFSVALGFSF